MMETLRNWLGATVVVTMLLSVAQRLIPDGSIQKIASLIGGLILLVTILQPLLCVDIQRLELQLNTYQRQLEMRQEELENEQKTELAGIIAEQTEAYISDKADELGNPVLVQVKTAIGEDGFPLPVSVTVWGTYSDALSAYVEEELGIRKERQTWYEREN